MEQRGGIPPGLPRAQSTLSYWQDPPSTIASLRSTATVPSKADYVIIGSGISGSSIAYHLLTKLPNANVVMLEAREACSGATGRNGGHTKAASYRTFLAHERELGLDEAIKIARMEYANILTTHALAEEQKIKCDSTLCKTIDIIYNQTTFDEGCQAIERMRQTMGENDPAAEYKIFNAQQTEKAFGTPNVAGSFEYLAGSISAYAFTTGILQICLSKGLNLQTNTPVDRIEYNPATLEGSGDTKMSWTVYTSRGSLITSNLILATNGYTAHLLPQTQGSIVPLHGQIIAHRPPAPLPATGSTHTWSFIREQGYEYMITRPLGSVGAGDVIIGGGIWVLPDEGKSRYGETNDASLEPDISAYLRTCTASYFASPVTQEMTKSRKEWSGIMGATADGIPFVGAVPESPGLWIAAGFNGHGMVWCLKAAEALAGIITGDNEGVAPQWFPKSAIITSQRLKVPFTGRKDLSRRNESAESI